MAIDPSLILQAAQAPNIGQIFSNILTNVDRFDTVKRNRENATLQSQLLQQRATQGEQQINAARQQQKFESIAIGSAEILPQLQKNDFDGVRATLQRRRQNLITQGKPTETTDEALALLDTNPQLLMRRAQQGVELGQRLGVFSGITGQSAGQRERSDLINTLKGAVNPETGQLIPENEMTATQKAAAIGLKLIAPVRDSAIERIVTDEDLAEKVTDFEAGKTGAEEGAKLKKQLAFRPQITRAVKLAEKEATERGETLTDLKRSEAAMPGLLDAVGQLRELATVATSTFGGKVFDVASKELGFGSTKGATAKAKFIAIINNQVLPLLKPTFGAAFTVQEGESLKATMGDPDASPEQKLAQLDAFIDQKRRDIQTKQTQLDQPIQEQQFQEGQTATNAQGQKIIFQGGQWVPFNG